MCIRPKRRSSARDSDLRTALMTEDMDGHADHHDDKGDDGGEHGSNEKGSAVLSPGRGLGNAEKIDKPGGDVTEHAHNLFDGMPRGRDLEISNSRNLNFRRWMKLHPATQICIR